LSVSEKEVMTMFPELHWWQFAARMYRSNLYKIMTEAWWNIIDAQINSGKDMTAFTASAGLQLCDWQRDILCTVTESYWDGVSDDIGDILADIEDAKGRLMP
jgi:hypothetical protein